MIEIVQTWDFLPGANLQAYGEFAKRTIGAVLQARGFIEFRANRNHLGSPQVRATWVWQSKADWESFFDNAAGRAIEDELRTYVTNYRTEIWGPSPLMPEPIRPNR